jgi:hypothetical protein
MNSLVFCTHEFIYYMNSSIQKMNSFTFCTYEFIYSMNSSVQNKWIHLIVVRVKPKPLARSANHEGKAQAARAKPEPQGRSPSRKGEARAHPLPRPGRAWLPRPLGYTRLPQPGCALLSRPLGYTRLPRSLGYTRLPQPVRARSQGGWVRMGLLR